MGLENKTDEELVLSVQKGKDVNKSFEVIFLRHEPKIKAHLLSYGMETAQAEDVIQDTFLKAFGKIDSYRETHKFKTWLYRIARNKVIDNYRKKKNNPLEVWEHIESSSQILVEDSKENSWINENRKEKIYSYVKNLPPVYREIIELRYYSGLEYETIAKELERPLGTIKGQMFRAHELLKMKMEKNEIF